MFLIGGTSFATTNTTTEANAFNYNYVRGYGNSFIFNEGGIEFSVFPDGQFDFYAQAFGPNLNVGFGSRNVSFSFNTGYNYNPYVQYDSFGAVIQIENTPIFYDYFGRVNQIGNIFINYNRFGRINRLGGLNIFWNGNVFLRHTGFINRWNRAYVFRPWHRFYAIPAANFCIVNRNPYRQFYTPYRHTYYRPYRNNVRHVNINGRRGNDSYGRYANTSDNSRRYAQTPRNARERSITRRAKDRNASINRNRSKRLAYNDSERRDTKVVTGGNSTHNNRGVSQNRTNRNDNVKRSANRNIKSALSTRANKNGTATSERRTTTSRAVTPNRGQRQNNSSVRKSSTTSGKSVIKAPNRTQRTVSQSKRKTSSVSKRPSSSRYSKSKSTRTTSRRRG
jgi:hypothetical protein